MVDKKMIGGAIALVTLCAIVLMGLAVVEGFSKEFRDDGSAANITLTYGAVNATTAVGATSAYGYLKTLTGCQNGTNASETIGALGGNYTITEGNADGGEVTITDAGKPWAGQVTDNCSVTYLEDSTLQGHADKFSTGLGVIASFIGVLVLSILGLFILNIWKGRKED